MKRLVSTVTLAAVLTLGGSQAFAGIIIGGRSEKPAKSKAGIIIGGKAGIIIGGKAGIIIGG